MMMREKERKEVLIQFTNLSSLNLGDQMLTNCR